jgi:RHS repeat-associated protein
VKTVTYDAFGAVLSDSAPGFDLPIGFGGGLADPVTGLVRLGRRDYDPRAGRFTARDPVMFAGSPLNLYAYAGSDPVANRDPTGLVCVGGEAYEGIGGGVTFCLDSKGASLCGRAGVGVGGGISVDPFGGREETGVKAYAQAEANFGPASVGGEASRELGDCGAPLEWSVGAGVGPLGASYGSDGLSVGADGDIDEVVEGEEINRKTFTGDGPWKWGGSASVGVEGCIGEDF